MLYKYFFFFFASLTANFKWPSHKQPRKNSNVCIQASLEVWSNFRWNSLKHGQKKRAKSTINCIKAEKSRGQHSQEQYAASLLQNGFKKSIAYYHW